MIFLLMILAIVTTVVMNIKRKNPPVQEKGIPLTPYPSITFLPSASSSASPIPTLLLSPTNSQVTPVPTYEPVTELKIEDIKIGTGTEVKSGNTIVVHYTGRLVNGTVFDSSVGGQPFITKIGVGQVIEGWEKGLLGMKVGGMRRLLIPPDLGYGSQGTGSIPPNATLIFDIELLEVK